MTSSYTPASLVNLRDVAELPAPADELLTRGVLWRSEAPQADDVPPEGMVWPPGTVVDLRDPGELHGLPHPLAAAGVEVVNLPLAGSLAPAEQATLREGGLTLGDLYLRLLERAEAWLPRLVEVAASAPAPILVHCAAGKDRTGITTALLLRLADVPADAVLADYLLTADVLDDLVPRLHLEDHRGRPTPRHLIGVDESGMRTALEVIGDDPAGFCRACGVADQDVSRWRARIRA